MMGRPHRVRMHATLVSGSGLALSACVILGPIGRATAQSFLVIFDFIFSQLFTIVQLA
jgi:hypothetical protein